MEDQQSQSWARMISKESSGENRKIKAVIICGPTGSGKSSLAMELAARFNGQIISADSRQIYRRLDIGTAKPTADDRARIPHHMIDVADVAENFAAKKYATMAAEAINTVKNNGQVPFVVGGAGLYLTALTDGLFEGPARDEGIRNRLENEIRKHGPSKLHSELAKIDPGSAMKIAPSDSIRIIRALEVFELTGKTMTELKYNGHYVNLDADYLWLGLNYPRDLLYRRIDRRVDDMIELGLIDEVQALVRDGFGEVLLHKKIVGYYEIINSLSNTISLENAILLIKQHSRNYAKRQLTWFRNKASVQWIDAEKNHTLEKINDELVRFLGKKS